MTRDASNGANPARLIMPALRSDALSGFAHEAGRIADTFGLELGSDDEVPADVLARAAALDAARASKDFDGADAIRAALQADGWTVETGKSGTTVRR